MKFRFALVTILFLAAPALSIADSSVGEMARRANESLAKDRDYEMASIRAFWGDISFMSECAPKGGPVAAPFTIYFEVLPNGWLGEVVLDPHTNTAECIRRHVMHHRFPSPPDGSYVTKIDMRFTP